MLANGTVDGAPMDPMTTLGYYLIVFNAGHDTTKNALAGGFRALIDNPAEFDKLRRDPARSTAAVEEILRYEPAVQHFRRTATQDTEIRGREIKEDDPVVIWYPAANRDEEIFEDPDRFDVARHPNEHLSFGIGEHFCLGASLARLELNAIFDEMVPRLRNPEFAGPVRRLRSNFINGMKEMKVEFTPTQVLG